MVQEEFPSLSRDEDPEQNTGSFVYDAPDPDPTPVGGVEPDYETQPVSLDEDSVTEEWDVSEIGDVA